MLDSTVLFLVNTSFSFQDVLASQVIGEEINCSTPPSRASSGFTHSTFSPGPRNRANLYPLGVYQGQPLGFNGVK